MLSDRSTNISKQQLNWNVSKSEIQSFISAHKTSEKELKLSNFDSYSEQNIIKSEIHKNSVYDVESKVSKDFNEIEEEI